MKTQRGKEECFANKGRNAQAIYKVVAIGGFSSSFRSFCLSLRCDPVDIVVNPSSLFVVVKLPELVVYCLSSVNCYFFGALLSA